MSSGHRPAALVPDAALYALIGCFLVHLALRGYWVALVGANSVFPDGVRWDRQREYGPIQAEVVQARVRPLSSFSARADNAASVVFATGFVLAAYALSTLGILGLLLAVAWALSALLPLRLALASSAAALGAWAVDLRRGARLRPGGPAWRAVRAVMRVLSGTTPDGVRSLGAVLTSNVDKRVVYAVLVVAFGGAYGSAGAAQDDGALPGGTNYTYFAEDAVLACAATLHAVTLDGQRVASRFRFFTNPRTERRGFLMLIPAATLAAGEHVLTVRPARRDPTVSDTVPIRTPFWR